MTLESKLPESTLDGLDESTLDGLEAIDHAITQLSLPYVRLLHYFNSAPLSRDKERLQDIEGWRKEQRQQINKQCADAAKIGTGKIGTGKIGTGKIGTGKIGTGKIGNGRQETVVDQKQRQKSAHLASQSSADQTPDINAAEQEKNAELRMTAHHQEAACRAEAAEKEFWDLLPDLAIPPGMTFVPFTNSKLFTAPECLEFPLEDAAQHWFHALCEYQEIELIIASALQKKRSWQKTLEKTVRVRRRYRSAGSAWSTHVGLLREAIAAGYPLEMFFMEGPNAEKPNAEKLDAEKLDAEKLDAEKPAAAQDAPEDSGMSSRGKTRDGKTSRGRKLPKDSAAPERSIDCLAAWAAAEIGERYLLPLMSQLSPGAPPEQRRQELTTEIWGAVLSLHAHRLTVPAFCRLPATAAAAVRELCSGAGGEVDRLALEAKRRLLAASSLAPDPLVAVIEAEGVEHIQKHIRMLPPRQRRSIELLLQGFSREEMAVKMDCKPESVKEHLERARRRLGSEMVEFKLVEIKLAGSKRAERVAPHSGS